MRSARRTARAVAVTLGVSAALLTAPAGSFATGAPVDMAAGPATGVPASLHEPANCRLLTPASGHSAWFCDDGVPDAGGTRPNLTGARAVTVPAKYQGHQGLPAKAADAATVPGADPRGQIALDVDVTLPAARAPDRGFPLMVMMHGCCSGDKRGWEADSFDAPGERWHYSNAWFAARGYVVLTYTARGFVSGERDGNRGSTGQTRLDSRSYEINDFQHLACQVQAAAGEFADVTGARVRIDPRGVVTTGGSYGGGFSWMALTDPKWTCTGDTGASGRRMSLAAVAPKYGFTDLGYELLPTGTRLTDPGSLPATDGCDTGPVRLDGSPCPEPVTPLGIPKESILAGLYASGKTGIPPGGPHATFPSFIDQAFACMVGFYPPEANPACSQTVTDALAELLRESSAYYQNRFFDTIARDPSWRVPVFEASTFGDPLFPGNQDRVMANRLRGVVPDYPIQVYAGEFQHFVQNKAKEWADLCTTGADRHVCTSDEYDRGLDTAPSTLVRMGATTRLNRFIDFYARPPLSTNHRQPRFDTTVSLQVCPQNAAALGVPPDEPGPTFAAPTFDDLTTTVLDIELPGTQTTLSRVVPNPHAVAADPVVNLLTNGSRCPLSTDAAGPGVATYQSGPLDTAQTMIGGTVVTATVQPPATTVGLQLNARLYDVFPDGTAVLVDRGPRRVTAAEANAGEIRFQLHGNAWRFERGHRIRIELAQDDGPYLRASDTPSSLTLTGVRLQIPMRSS